MTTPKPDIVIVGFGALGSALAHSFCKNGGYSPSQIGFIDPSVPKQQMARQLGYILMDDEPAPHVHYVFICMKPDAWKVNPCPVRSFKSAVIVSMMAGVPLSDLEYRLGKGNGNIYVRVATNTPVMVGIASSAICFEKGVLAEERDKFLNLMSLVGIVHVCEERDMDTIMSVSGCGPAMVYVMIEAMAEAAVKRGLSMDVALRFAAQTVKGAAEMLSTTKKHPAILKNDVASPGGSTICMLQEMEARGFRYAVLSSIEKAAEKIKSIADESFENCSSSN